MTMVSDLTRKRAIKRYARELPSRLYRDYGASTFFTPGQIVSAARKLKLPSEFLVYGYAMFLPKEIFEEIKTTLQNLLSYEEARAGFVTYKPTTTPADSNFYESKLGFFTPGDSGPNGTGF